MEKLQQYVEANKDRFLNELIELLRISSVSADSSKKGDVKRAAEYIQNQLLKAGADSAELITTPGHPIVYGEKLLNPNVKAEFWLK